MRSNVDPQKIKQLMKILGREAQGSGCTYFTGGASALLDADTLRIKVENFITLMEADKS